MQIPCLLARPGANVVALVLGLHSVPFLAAPAFPVLAPISAPEVRRNLGR